MKNLLIILLAISTSLIGTVYSLNIVSKTTKAELDNVYKEIRDIKTLNAKLDSTLTYVNKHKESN